MQPGDLPPDAMFIRWGRFQAGAFGRPAVLILGAALFCGIATRLLGLW